MKKRKQFLGVATGLLLLTMTMTGCTDLTSLTKKEIANQTTFSANNTKPTNEPVMVTVHFPVNAKSKQVKIGAGKWTEYTDPLQLNENNSVYAKYQDVNGVWSNEVFTQISNIDQEPPDTPYLNVDGSNVYVRPASETDLLYFKVGESGNWKPYGSPFSLDKTNIVYAKSMDTAGNISDVIYAQVEVPEINFDDISIETPEKSKYPTHTPATPGKGSTGTKTHNQTTKVPIKDMPPANKPDKLTLEDVQEDLKKMNLVYNDDTISLKEVKEIRNHATELLTAMKSMKRSDDLTLARNKLNKLIIVMNQAEKVLSTSNDASYDENLYQTVKQMPGGNLKELLLSHLEKSLIGEAKRQVEKAEENPSQSALDQATDIISDLPDGAERNALEKRLSKINIMVNVTQLVDQAEATLKQSDYDTAEKAISSLDPNTQVFKQLNRRLNDIHKRVEVETLVEVAEITKEQRDVDKARVAVNKISDSSNQSVFHSRLDQIDASLKNAQKIVKALGKTPTDTKLNQARSVVDALIESPAKTSLLNQLEMAKA